MMKIWTISIFLLLFLEKEQVISKPIRYLSTILNTEMVPRVYDQKSIYPFYNSEKTIYNSNHDKFQNYI